MDRFHSDHLHKSKRKKSLLLDIKEKLLNTDALDTTAINSLTQDIYSHIRSNWKELDENSTSITNGLIDILNSCGKDIVNEHMISILLNSTSFYFGSLKNASCVFKLLEIYDISNISIELNNAIAIWIQREYKNPKKSKRSLMKMDLTQSNDNININDGEQQISTVEKMNKLIEWWIKDIPNSRKSNIIKSIISIHLTYICTTDIESARTIVLNAGNNNILTISSKDIQEGIIQFLCNCVSLLPPSEFFFIMYPNKDSYEINKQALLTPWERELRRIFIHHLLKQNKIKTYDNINNELTFSNYVSKDKTIWPKFIIWYPYQCNIIDNIEHNLSNYSINIWKELTIFYKEIINIIENDYINFSLGNCSITLINNYININRELLEQVYKNIEKSNAINIIISLYNEINDILSNNFNKIEEWSKLFINTSNIYKEICSIKEKWFSLYIKDIRIFLGIDISDNNIHKNNKYNILPKTLINSWQWLYININSQLFKIIWEEQNSYINENKIIPTSIALNNEYNNILSKKITFKRMYTIAPILNNNNEREYFLATAPGFKQNNNRIEWNILDNISIIDKNNNLSIIIKDWLHLKSVYETLPNIIRILNCLHIFIKINGLSSLENVKNAAKILQDIFLKENFNDKTLNDLHKYTKYSNIIDECFVYNNPNLFESIKECMELLEWLRELTDDKDFTNSIEQAMGKSEMECPPELWQDTKDGKPGRVDEQKLSMLSAVRSYLYDLIYRKDDRLDNLLDVINIIKKLRKTDDNIINSINISNKYRIYLKELLNDQSDNSAPDRLIQLLQPQKETTWICSNINLLHKGEIYLKWKIIKSNIISEKKQNLNELMDFQSSIILAKTDQQGPFIKNTIDKFIQQFAWIRILCENICNLLKAGHFDYQEFNISYNINTDPNIIRKYALDLGNILEQWNLHVSKQRYKYYYLNFYNIKYLWQFIITIRSINNINDIENLNEKDKKYEIFRNIICLLSNDLNDHFNIINYISIFYNKWKETEDNNNNNMKLNAEDTLKLCGECLQYTFNNICINTCSISQNIKNIVSNYISGSEIENGINVICVENNQYIYDQILSIYARYGYFPEREYIYICRKLTTWEDIINLLLRWLKSHENNRMNKIYCLASIENICFEYQRKIAIFIKENLSSTKNPLVIISGNALKQHLVAQFAHCRINTIPLPENIIKQYTKELKQSSRKIKVYSSIHAGAGKTFNIKTKTYKNKHNYIPVSIMTSKNILNNIVESINYLNIDIDNDYFTLHFDIYDTINTDINPILFDLLFLGSIEDDNKTQIFFWPYERCNIAIEIPSGDIINKLRLCSLLPEKKCIVNGSTFCTSKILLKQGMGQDFYSKRNDGTYISLLNASLSNNEELNAYKRLQYVCTGLEMMDANNGRFPFVMEENNKPLLESLRYSQKSLSESTGSIINTLTSERCFSLIIDQLQLSKPSLWCIWNFINVFYWELRNMHHPSSPINCACMPDTSRPSDIDIKAKFKGEVIQYLINTAKEFATRQVKQDIKQDIFGIWVSGMTRRESNGLWEKMDYDHDGQMVFRKKCLMDFDYLYYRKDSNQWVIDSEIIPKGASYSFCEKGIDIDGLWSTTPAWSVNKNISVKVIKHPEGYNGEAVEVTGCDDKGGSAGLKENGIYLRQPEYDNINEKPHYIKFLDPSSNRNARRHLFFEYNSWQICPRCNDEDGTYIIGPNSLQTDRGWQVIPPNIKEDRARIKKLSEEEYKEYIGKTSILYVRAKPRDRSQENKINKQIDLLSLNDSVDSINNEETMEELWDNTLKWNDSNHECVLFSNETHVVRFLSLHPEKLRTNMLPGLLKHLKQNQINVGEDLDKLTDNFYDILSSLTEVKKTQYEAKNILNGNYCLTGDSLLKMLAIFARLRCGVPVVLMGECGCGKTMLINYLCAWMNIKLLILDVHGGTNEDDILNIFKEAEKNITNNLSKIFVFLDEINTCSHMGLLCEVICHRSLYGKRISDQIHVLAALNPYRRRPNTDNTPGLVFQLTKNKNTIPDPMSHLVYKVHPIPDTLKDFIFDFGSLTSKNENLYIASMVNSQLINISNDEQLCILTLIHESQQFIRKTIGDESAASLRDVKRCLYLINWFKKIVIQSSDTMSNGIDINILSISTILALSFVYYYRINNIDKRTEYWILISNNIPNIPGFSALKTENRCERLLKHFQRFIGSKMKVEEGIAMNDALMENLFVVIICILTRIPIFVVGKPGSSKTLTMQVIASNLQGEQSMCKFWRKYPAVYIFPYQCSPMSDSNSIQHQFDMAVRYQESSDNTITILLLDEVGLAEHSPDMPLKVLHGMLVDPPIAVVGLSNWVLDPAKMNRAILLQRTEPSKIDIQSTGKGILSSNKNNNILDKYLPSLSQAYHNIYTSQKGRDFIGMRDFYNLIKLLRYKLKDYNNNNNNNNNIELDPNLLTFSICRNFGGKKELIENILNIFHNNCFGNINSLHIPIVTDLIQQNLKDPKARHLMLLTKNSSALSLLFGSKILNERTTKVLIGSEFKDDKTELHLITQINEVKLAMAEGSTLVLLNHDNIYEALYDVLNQRYLHKKDNFGNIKKMLRLAIGSRSQLCNVADSFKMVVIVEQNHAYRNLDLPLLNRFEKQLLTPNDILGIKQNKIVDQLEEWVNSILKSTGLNSKQDIFCGYHKGTIPSAVLYLTQYNDNNVNETTYDIIKLWLSNIALPIAMLNSSELQKYNNLSKHSCLPVALETYIYPNTDIIGSLYIILSHSPISHLYETFNIYTPKCKPIILQLGELTSERQLITNLNNFFNSNINEDSIMIIQCDPIICKPSLIHHARYICIKERSQYEYNINTLNIKYKRHIIFLIHLPPGTKLQNRHYSLDFIPPWTYIFIDDLRIEPKTKANFVTLLQNSIYSLVNKNIISIEDIYIPRYQQALSTCKIPNTNHPAGFFGNRMKSLSNLLNNIKEFKDFIYNTMMNILKKYSSNIGISNKENATKVPIHVKMVCNNLIGGSLRQSLDISIQTFIIQAFSFIISQLDINFNLSTRLVENKEELSHDLWLSLFKLPCIIDSNIITNRANIGNDSSIIIENVKNTGLYGAHISKFPFSYQIITILNNTSTREQVQRLNTPPQDTLTNICIQTFGNNIIEKWNKFAGNEHLEYLYDFINIASIYIPGANFDDIYKLYILVLRITRYDSLQSIPNIHAFIWQNEELLFRYSKLLANNLIPLYIRNNILQTLENIEKPTNKSNNSLNDIKNRLILLDYIGLDCLLSNQLLWIEDLIENNNNQENILLFINEFSSIHSDIQLTLLSLSSYKNNTNNNNNNNISLESLKQKFLSIKVFHIYFQETIQDSSIICSKKLFNHIQNINIKDVLYFIKLIELIFENISNDIIFIYIDFIRRYIQEIIFGENQGFYNINLNYSLSNEFISILENIFENNNSNILFNNLSNNLFIKRTILRCLLQINHPLKLQNIESQQLYLQNICDDLTYINNWKDSNILSIEDTNVIYILDRKLTLNELKSLANIQMAIKDYCYNLIYPNNNSLHSFIYEPLKTLLYSENHIIKVYALKAIKAIAGIDGIGELARSKENLTWIPLDRRMVTKIDLPDPYVWMSQNNEYELICGYIRSSSVQEDNLDSLSKLDSCTNTSLILAAIYSQITLNQDNISMIGLEKLREYIHKHYEYKDFYNLLLDGCKSLLNIIDITTLSGLCQFQISINLAIWATESQHTWLHSLFFNPELLLKSYLISIPDDEFAELVRISNARGWYACPNGHKYSVGQCGLPMEQTKCPVETCGATIGGSSHVSSKGVKKISNTEQLQGDLEPGYSLSSNDSEAIRLSPIVSRVLRLLLHIGLLISSCLNDDNKNHINILLNNNTSDLLNILYQKVNFDWNKICKYCELGSGDLTIALNKIIQECRTNIRLSNGSSIISSCDLRNREEQKLSNMIESILCHKKLKNIINKSRLELQKANSQSTIRLAAGDKLWNEIIETDNQSKLWRYCENISYNHFIKEWKRQPKQILSRYPLLSNLIKEEERLSLIHGLSDILAWHKILFDVIPHMSITRTDAMDITNIDIINKLPKEKQEKGKNILISFCNIFNKILPTIETLYECDENPFIKNGKVDIGGQEMNENTCIAFSLPSIIKGSDRGNFINGVCTIRILEILADCQNDILESILKSSNNRKKRYQSKFNNNKPIIPVKEERKTPNVPAISYMTSPKLLNQQLIIYNREKDFLPLLRIFIEQSLEYKHGEELHYDFDMIENALSNGLLAGKRPINLCISHFQYLGDIQIMGQLSLLELKLSQEKQLPNHIKEAISSEVDTQNHAIRLLKVLELCIQFIVSIGDSGNKVLNSKINLSSLVLDTLQYPLNEWDEIKTPTISQQITLCYIQPLYYTLESFVNGNPIDEIPTDYCKSLSEEEEKLLRNISSKIDINIFVAKLHNFIVNILNKNIESITPDKDFKYYLGSTDLEYEDWWKDFPEGFTLSQCKSIYTLFASFN